MRAIANSLGPVIFIGLGVLQLAATIAGIQVWLGLSVVLAVILAVFFAWMPLVGTAAVGMYGAVTAWGWSWALAGGVFFGAMAFGLLLTLLASIADKSAKKA